MEFTHNLGLMCDVLSEPNDLSKQSGKKGRRKKRVRKQEEKRRGDRKEEEIRTLQELCWGRLSIWLLGPLVPVSLLERQRQVKHGLLRH